jgi:hypothetical protein
MELFTSCATQAPQKKVADFAEEVFERSESAVTVEKLATA